MNKITDLPNIEPLYKLYLSSAFGAFCLGFGDLLNNQKAATVLKISEVIKQNLYADLEIGGLIALVALAMIGGIVCWIHQPLTSLVGRVSEDL